MTRNNIPYEADHNESEIKSEFWTIFPWSVQVIRHLISTRRCQQLTQNRKIVWKEKWEYFTSIRLSFTSKRTKQIIHILQNKVCLMLRIVWRSPRPERAQHWLHEVAQTPYILLKSVFDVNLYFFKEKKIATNLQTISTISYESSILSFLGQNNLCPIIKYISLSKWRLNH